jgi:rhamnosyltransferase
MKVSIILPTYNVEKNIRNLLNSIYDQKFDGKIEVLIIDSSDDNTPNIVKNEFPQAQMIRVESEDYNYGKTRNEGAEMTDGECIVFLSADINIADETWLSKLIKPFNDPNVAGVFGRQLPKEGAYPMERFFICHTYPSKSYTLSLNKNGKIKKSFFFSNTNSAIRRSIWKKHKIPEMLMSEDQEWGKRVVLDGYKIIYSSEALVYHSHNYSLKDNFQRFFDSGATLAYVYNDNRIEKKNFMWEGMTYELGELKYLLQSGHALWMPYALLYDFMKFLGYLAGTQQKYMPVWMKKALCKKTNHWSKYDDIILE